MGKTKKDDYKNAAIISIVAVLSILISAALPFMALAAVFVLAYAVAMWGTMGIAVAIISFALGCVVDVKTSAFLAAAFLPMALTAGIVIKKKRRMRESVMATSGAALIGTAAAFGVLWLYTGLGPIDYVVDKFGHLLGSLGNAAVALLYQFFRSVDMLTGAITQTAVLATPASEAITFIQDRLRESMNVYLVSDILTYALLMGLLIFVITRVFVKKTRKVVVVPSFSALTLPKRFWLAYLLSLLLAFAGTSFGWASFDTVQITIYSVYGFVFTIQGLSFLDYLYKKRQMQTAVRVLLHVVLAMLIGYILVWVGLFENMANLRKRLDTEGGIVS